MRSDLKNGWHFQEIYKQKEIINKLKLLTTERDFLMQALNCRQIFIDEKAFRWSTVETTRIISYFSSLCRQSFRFLNLSSEKIKIKYNKIKDTKTNWNFLPPFTWTACSVKLT